VDALKYFKRWLPFLAILLSIILEIIIETDKRQIGLSISADGKQLNLLKETNYYLWFLIVMAVIALLFGTLSYFNIKVKEKLEYKGIFWVGVLVLINVYNLVTTKFNILPTIYFPSPTRIIGVIFEDRTLILKCLGYSARLLLTGFFSGAIIGLLCGIAIGFSKRVSYWISPLVRFLGPIPSTAWIPIALVSFSDTVTASSFIIALAVWFPTTLMTSSGIQNVANSFFEVSETLGAGLFYKIFKVAVPAAMPGIFIGIFNGICSAFITLMTAEMIGAKYGIGWYINWQKEMMCYSNVYAGLIVIAVTFSILITLLFKVKDRLLIWQKGVIKW